MLSDSLSFFGDEYQSMFDDGIVRSARFLKEKRVAAE